MVHWVSLVLSLMKIDLPETTGWAHAGESATYAAREAAAPALAAFAGGERGGIYIGGSALVIVLLVVIIVILV